MARAPRRPRSAIASPAGPHLVAGPGAAPARASRGGHMRSPDLEPSTPLPNPRTLQVPGPRADRPGSPFRWMGGGSWWGKRWRAGHEWVCWQSEQGVGAPRGSTLLWTPSSLIALFLGAGGFEQRYCAVVYSSKTAGWKRMRKSLKQVTSLWQRLTRVMFRVRREVSPSSVSSSAHLSLCWGR